MALPYFYEEHLPLTGNHVLSEESSRHVAQVLRMQPGEQLLLTDGKGLIYTSEIVTAHKKNTIVSLLDSNYVPRKHPIISIAVSFIKNTGRFEWFLEKATETGVSAIFPIICTRTEKTHYRADRMKTILVSAMLQSRQAWLPELSLPLKFNDFLHTHIVPEKFIAHCVDGEKNPLTQAMKDPSVSKSILIGPEGDFTPEEIEEAISHQYIPVSLGETRLRTETAALVSAVLLRFVE